MAFVPRRRRADDRWLEWKVRIFSLAAVLGLAGIYADERWLTGSAIAVLAGGLLLRFLPGEDEPAWEDGDGAGGEEGDRAS